MGSGKIENKVKLRIKIKNRQIKELMKEKMLRSFIDFAERNMIKYALLGNVQSYPHEIASDIDIVVSRNEFNRISEIVHSFCIEYDFHLCNILQHEVSGKYFVIAKIDTDNQTITNLAFDFCSDYMRQGRIILTADELLANTVQIEQNHLKFFVCEIPKAFAYYFIKKIEKKSINQSQFDYLYNIWKTDKSSCLDYLSKIFEKKSLQLIEQIFDSKKIELLDGRFLETLSKQTLQRYRITSKVFLFNFFRIFKRVTKPTGMIIAFYGCDGSGKSTLINEFMSEKKDLTAFRAISYHHLYPKKTRNINALPVTNPHEQVPRTVWASNLKLLYFLFIYTVGYWRIIYPQKIKSNLVIFDRYYFDILVDSRRYRHNGSNWLTKLVGYLIPKPDLTIIVDATPETLQNRKQEVSFEETKRQRIKYLDLKNHLKNVVVVDNESDIQKAFFATNSAIFEKLIKRYKNRYL